MAKKEPGFVEKEVVVSLSEVINNDNEGFLDILEKRTLGKNGVLSDIEYEIVGHLPQNELRIKVSGFKVSL